jgi:hypothetical protein
LRTSRFLGFSIWIVKKNRQKSTTKNQLTVICKIKQADLGIKISPSGLNDLQ